MGGSGCACFGVRKQRHFDLTPVGISAHVHVLYRNYHGAPLPSLRSRILVHNLDEHGKSVKRCSVRQTMVSTEAYFEVGCPVRGRNLGGPVIVLVLARFVLPCLDGVDHAHIAPKALWLLQTSPWVGDLRAASKCATWAIKHVRILVPRVFRALQEAWAAPSHGQRLVQI